MVIHSLKVWVEVLNHIYVSFDYVILSSNSSTLFHHPTTASRFRPLPPDSPSSYPHYSHSNSHTATSASSIPTTATSQTQAHTTAKLTYHENHPAQTLVQLKLSHITPHPPPSQTTPANALKIALKPTPLKSTQLIHSKINANTTRAPNHRCQTP